MMKEHFFFPGPTPVPTRIHQAMQLTNMHHRIDVFAEQLKETLAGIRTLTRCSSDPVFIAGSGTAAMEATLVNLCKAGDKVLALNAGQFGQRWLDIAGRLGLNALDIKAEWGQTVDLQALETFVKANREAACFCLQYLETSTTVMHPVPEIVKVIRRVAPEMLIVVDVISCLATLPIHMDEIDLDVLVGGGHKGLMLPPGLAILCLSNRAWERAEKNGSRSLYFDIVQERSNHAKGTTSWTPAITLILGLREALAMLNEEGLPAVYARHQKMSRAARASLSALGFELLANEHPAPGVTAAFPLKGMTTDSVRSAVYKDFGVRLAGGQGKFKGQVFRIGHMGYMNCFDVITAISALELGLIRAGLPVQPGQGVSAAIKIFAEG
jgi:aspartate aminotransferase-like enzyme